MLLKPSLGVLVRFLSLFSSIRFIVSVFKAFSGSFSKISINGVLLFFKPVPGVLVRTLQ